MYNSRLIESRDKKLSHIHTGFYCLHPYSIFPLDIKYTALLEILNIKLSIAIVGRIRDGENCHIENGNCSQTWNITQTYFSFCHVWKVFEDQSTFCYLKSFSMPNLGYLNTIWDEIWLSLTIYNLCL